MNSPILFLNFEAMGTRPELPDYLDIEGDEDYDEVLGNCSSCLLLDDVL